MAIEIERKFLVRSRNFLAPLTPSLLVQGYLHDSGATSRVRIVDAHEAWLTIKGRREGLARPEFEYPIPLEDAYQLLSMCGERVLRKLRYNVVHCDNVWHVDTYEGRLSGLSTAEIELAKPDERFETPQWLGREITFDKRYTNKRLACGEAFPLELAA